VQQQQQPYEPLSAFTNITDFGANQNGFGMTVPNAIANGRSPLSFPQQQPNINPLLNPNPLLLQQQQQLQLQQQQQQPNFFTDNNNSSNNNITMYTDADVIRNRLLLQQQLQQQQLQQQQQQQMLSFGGLGSQFPQQNQYNALLQQQKLMSNFGMTGRPNLGMGPPNFSAPNSHNLFTPQQQQQPTQVAMPQMQFMNHSIPSALSNNISSSSKTTPPTPPPVQMNSLSETSALSSASLTSSANQPPPPPPPPPSPPSLPMDDGPLNGPNDSEPLDTFDWWK
jgi:hypothetical protein